MLSYLIFPKPVLQSLLIVGLFPFLGSVCNAQWSVHLGLINSQTVDPLVSNQSYEGFGLNGRVDYSWSGDKGATTVALETGRSRLGNRQNNYWDSRSLGFFLHSDLPATSFFPNLSFQSGFEAQLLQIESFFFMQSKVYNGRKSGFGSIRIPLVITSNYLLTKKLPITWSLNMPMLQYTLRPGYSVFDPEELFNKPPTIGNILKSGQWSPIGSFEQWQWELKWSSQSNESDHSYALFIQQKHHQIPFPQTYKSNTIYIGVGVNL